MLFVYDTGMRKSNPISITPSQRQELASWLRLTTAPQGKAQRARIILGLVDGMRPADVSAQLGISEKSVHKWKKRFAEEGVPGLPDST